MCCCVGAVVVYTSRGNVGVWSYPLEPTDSVHRGPLSLQSARRHAQPGLSPWPMASFSRLSPTTRNTPNPFVTTAYSTLGISLTVMSVGNIQLPPHQGVLYFSLVQGQAESRVHRSRR